MTYHTNAKPRRRPMLKPHSCAWAHSRWLGDKLRKRDEAMEAEADRRLATASADFEALCGEFDRPIFEERDQ